MNALFVCSQNRLRSPTAEEIFSSLPGIECESAGTDHSANVPLDPELIEWAEIIFVMERTHRNRITKKFKTFLNGKRIIVLNIPDEYEFMEPALIDQLNKKVMPFLQSHVTRNR